MDIGLSVLNDGAKDERRDDRMQMNRWPRGYSSSIVNVRLLDSY